MWFEVLLYMSLTLDALSVAFQDRTPTAEITQDDDHGATVIAAVMILLLVYSGLACGAAAQELAALGAVGRAGAVGLFR